MRELNLRFHEYKLALLFFRASAVFMLNRKIHNEDKQLLLSLLFEYCYQRYLTFQNDIDIHLRNTSSVKSVKAKEKIISFLQINSPDRARNYCNLIFGVKNWSYVLPLDYYRNND